MGINKALNSKLESSVWKKIHMIPKFKGTFSLAHNFKPWPQRKIPLKAPYFIHFQIFNISIWIPVKQPLMVNFPPKKLDRALKKTHHI